MIIIIKKKILEKQEKKKKFEGKNIQSSIFIRFCIRERIIWRSIFCYISRGHTDKNSK